MRYQVSIFHFYTLYGQSLWKYPSYLYKPTCTGNNISIDGQCHRMCPFKVLYRQHHLVCPFKCFWALSSCVCPFKMLLATHRVENLIFSLSVQNKPCSDILHIWQIPCNPYSKWGNSQIMSQKWWKGGKRDPYHCQDFTRCHKRSNPTSNQGAVLLDHQWLHRILLPLHKVQQYWPGYGLVKLMEHSPTNTMLRGKKLWFL